MPESDQTPGSGIRVVVQQPALAKYRLPVFRELASRPGFEVLVRYGQERLIKNVEAEGFRAEPSRSRWWRTPIGLLGWDATQIRFATRRRCDVLVLSWNTRLLSLFPALIRARLSGIGVVLWGHGYSKTESRTRRWFRMLPTLFAQSIMFYNHTAARASGLAANKTFVALNSLDQSAALAERERLLGDPTPISDLRNRFGLDGPVILFVSRLIRENRLDLLFDAVAKLKDRLPGTRICVVGSGPDEEYLKNAACEAGIESNVVFAGAIYEEQEVAAWFMIADVFCYPANIGLSILHAFGYGLPVVTSDNLDGQNPEIEAMRDGENGLLYTDGDSGALAAALERLLTDDELRGRMSAEALRTVREEFTVERMVDGMEAAIRCAYESTRS